MIPGRHLVEVHPVPERSQGAAGVFYAGVN